MIEPAEWNVYSKSMPCAIFTGKEQVNVKCPICGKLIYRRTDIVLTTYPAKYQYECECGWRGTAFI